jgi:hypothetical protein
MIMPKIENLEQLRFEIARLEKVRFDQESQLKMHITDLRESFKPVNLLLKAVSSITGIKMEKNAFLKDGILYGFSLLFQKVLLKTEKKAEETVHHVVDSLFEKVQGFVNRHTGHQARKDQENSGDENAA